MGVRNEANRWNMHHQADGQGGGALISFPFVWLMGRGSLAVTLFLTMSRIKQTGCLQSSAILGFDLSKITLEDRVQS